MLVAVVKGDYKAYYRKQGLYCFDFVTKKDLATDLTEQECERVVRNSDYYLKMFGARHMVVENVAD